MGLFLAAGVFGVLFFIASLIFGDHDIGHDHGDAGGDHSGASVFSLFNISWFLIGFGGAGAVMRAYGVSVPLSTLAGLLTGMIFWALAFSVMHLMAKQQGDSTVTTARIMNTIGTVVLPIPENGVGKMQCSVSGATQEFLVRSMNGAKLPVGSRVRIIGDAGGVYTVESV